MRAAAKKGLSGCTKAGRLEAPQSALNQADRHACCHQRPLEPSAKENSQLLPGCFTKWNKG